MAFESTKEIDLIYKYYDINHCIIALDLLFIGCLLYGAQAQEIV